MLSNQGFIFFLTHAYPRKPKNARSKRALEAREPKEVEDVKKVIFIKGNHAGELVGNVIKELVR